ncbi:CAP domain-containing protein [Algibacter miyuki]|uniref:CAP domain-containing protein n=1 Tax=Algibacter miyuki TaxID=1306933 RepID=A0ABV5H384_9FLAO|nr:CAP domain-containing protein [Algibacter miyuki]MDN3665406.1 CAP domain-containing protein [Algibacter miyuki]
MKILTKLPLIALLALFSFSCSPENTNETFDDIQINSEALITKSIELETLELINEYRDSLGLKTLDNMDIIKSVAFSHTDYMMENNKISHDNFFKRSEYLKTHTGVETVSENVAYGFSSAKTLVKAWIASEGHRKTMEGDFTNFDISAEKNENGRWYYTNIFVKK